MLSSVVSQMTSIREIVLGVWMTNMQLVSLLTKASSTPPSPDTRFTWAQAPVRLEDALGRVLPVPSEYCWGVWFRLSINADIRSDRGRRK